MNERYKSGICPRVLIVGETFHSLSGGGITLSNLFEGWPKDKLAVITWPKNIRKTNFQKCDQCYQLGVLEYRPYFPLNIFISKYPSGPIDAIPDKNKSHFANGTVSIVNRLKKITSSILSKFGLNFYLSRLIVSDQILEWIDQYSPDIIYTQLSSLDLIRFIDELIERRNFKLVIHMMDDWPSSLNQSIIAHKYWGKQIDRRLRFLFDRASLLLSISEAMSDEYKVRYKKSFTHFHNPVKTEVWLPYQKKNWEIKDNTFRMLYTGRIGTANAESISKLANIIPKLNFTGMNIHLDIYTPDHNISVKKEFGSDHVSIKPPVQYTEMPNLLSKYDLLLLPLDFSEEGIRFAKLSMPTKASEYMISGVPILVYASGECALAKHALRHKWAFCVVEEKEQIIIEMILHIISSSRLRENIATTAAKFAIENFDADLVKNNFQQAIKDTYNL